MNDTVRDNLKKFREEAGLTTEEAARLSGVKIDSLRRYESLGGGVSGEILFKLAKTYGRESVNDFFSVSPPPVNPLAIPLFHASTARSDLDDYEAKKFREVEDMLVKANREVAEHRKELLAQRASKRDKSNPPKK